MNETQNVLNLNCLRLSSHFFSICFLFEFFFLHTLRGIVDTWLAWLNNNEHFSKTQSLLRTKSSSGLKPVDPRIKKKIKQKKPAKMQQINQVGVTTPTYNFRLIATHFIKSENIKLP